MDLAIVDVGKLCAPEMRKLVNALGVVLKHVLVLAKEVWI
jgi:hypothetical protein